MFSSQSQHYMAIKSAIGMTSLSIIEYKVPEIYYIGIVVISLNSLDPGGFEQNFRYVIFKLISVTDGWGISCKIALRWMPQYLTDDKSTLVQVMAWRC